MPSSSPPSVLVWLGRNLRMHDNPALASALATGFPMRCLFFWDPQHPEKMGALRRQFLGESLEDLDAGLRTQGSRLYVVDKNPAQALPELVQDWNVQTLIFQQENHPYDRQLQNQMSQWARTQKVRVQGVGPNTVYDLEAVLQLNGGEPPLTYQKFLGLIGRLIPQKPLALEWKSLAKPPTDTEDQYRLETSSLQRLIREASSGKPPKFRGGETAGLARLHQMVREAPEFVQRFAKPQTAPNSLDPSTTVLSPYIAMGNLSVRTIYQEIQKVYANFPPTHQPPVSLVGQLWWREFYYVVARQVPKFDQMQGNSLCKQIPWEDQVDLQEAWKTGQTGFPFIDAIMVQLRTEGWIHHLARHAVACFLTRGHLWQSWEVGQAVFEDLLLDADWALNAGNWMWLSASAFFFQYFRVYSPVAFGKKTDPEGQYIRKYLPVLRKMPKAYIYEPWKAPLTAQHAAGCLIGQDYPHPIVDLAEAQKTNLARMKTAYAAQSKKRLFSELDS